MLELIEHGADVNYAGKFYRRLYSNQSEKIIFGKRPLFRARTHDAVELLLKYGADPCLKASMGQFEEAAKDKKVTAIEHLMKYNPICAQAILDNYLHTDKEDNLVLNFHIFKEDEENEMALFEVTREVELQDAKDTILLHPVMQTFLNLKYKTVWTTLSMQLLFQIALVIVYTAIGIEFVNFTTCEIFNGTTNGLNQTVCLNDESYFKLKSGSIGCKINDTHSQIPIQDSTSHQPVICRLNTLRLKENVNFLQTVCPFEECGTYYLLYTIFWIVTVIFLLKEFGEIISLGIKAYFSRFECFNEILLVCLSIAFGITSINGYKQLNLNPNLQTRDFDANNLEYNNHHLGIHFAAWMVFLVWINLILYLGRVHVIGIYIFMALDVTKNMIFALMTFSPAFAAFTFGFYILIQTNRQFDDLTRTLIRTLPMMAGEFDFDDYYDFKAVQEYGGRNYSAQIMFIFFVVIIVLIIGNLLIALTVSKIDALEKKSKLLQVKRMIDDVISLTSLVQKNKIKCIRKLMDPMNIQKPILERLQNCSKVL